MITPRRHPSCENYDRKPVPLVPCFENIPEVLKGLDQWVCWDYRLKNGKWTKVPINARTGQNACTVSPSSWCSYELAKQRYEQGGLAGIGFVFDPEGGLTGIDIDDCINEAGEVSSEAKAILSKFGSYSEVSPSGRGIKIWVCADLRPLLGNDRCGTKNGNYEAYSGKRFFTVTGKHIEKLTSVAAEQQGNLRWFVENYLQKKPNANKQACVGVTIASLAPADSEIWDAIKRSVVADKVDRLMAGDIASYGDDDSVADLALASQLAFFFGPDRHRVEQAFNRSALAEREKWKNRPDYRERTISKALEGKSEFYKPCGTASFTCNATATERQKNNFGHKAGSTAVRTNTPKWPALDRAAYYGLAGRIVSEIEPHSEADPVGLLIQLLAAFGNVIGRTAHFLAEGTPHFLNLFIVLAGVTSKARKGTSWGRVKRYIAPLGPEWLEKRVLGGLISGEGMVYAVRDRVSKKQPVKSKGQIISYNEAIEDEGEDDKRLLCLEEEYACVIRAMERQGNSLSARMREAWQGQPVGSLTKNSPTRCKEPHISVIGHLTIEEAKRYLTATEMANGWGNRHLWLCVQRSKLLPEGSNSEPAPELLKELQFAAGFVQTTLELKRDEQAKELWSHVYGDLSDGKPGMAGAMTARAEAQTMRLGCLYAVLDQSPTIKLAHLQAALALWNYCEQSVRYIFGESTGDQTADEILRGLRAAGSAGMTRKAISDLFHHNRSAGDIGRALAFLQEHRLARMASQETGGRPAEIWCAISAI